ncbi:hypothetical protein AB0E63_30385 [Kribbella sp. NPDC026596]|uniref:hypothetical protein n=1 Tax=Kribbella sp. NPDC026596 TaxID=3155122 RepID=UPI0034078A69
MVQYAKRDDTPTGVFYLGSRSMAMLKEGVCKSTVWQMRQEARRPGMLDLWFKDRQRRKMLDTKAGKATVGRPA